MNNQQREQLLRQAQQLCQLHKVTIRPYGSAWWLAGEGISLVVSQLEGLSPSHLARLQIVERPQRES
jgi:hypothetical protein